MNLRYLRCPKCYETYEISEEIYLSFDKLRCSHCQHSTLKENFHTEVPISKDTETKSKFSEEETVSHETVTVPIKKMDEQQITIEKVNLDNESNGNTTNEMIKNLVIMIAVLAALAGFVFLMIRK